MSEVTNVRLSSTAGQMESAGSAGDGLAIAQDEEDLGLAAG